MAGTTLPKPADRARILSATTAAPLELSAADTASMPALRLVGSATVVLALDLGTKTSGVAASDPERRLATGVETIERKTFTLDAKRLLSLAAERNSAGFVLGLPINMDGSEGPRAQSTRAFARNLSRLTELPIGLWDERLSTVAVERELIINALQETRGNQVHAARLLGITRATLRKRIEKFRIQQELQVK